MGKQYPRSGSHQDCTVSLRPVERASSHEVAPCHEHLSLFVPDNEGDVALDALLAERPDFVRRTLNAIYGSLQYMLENRDYAINLIATNNELPVEIATMEFDKTFGRLSRDGQMTRDSV